MQTSVALQVTDLQLGNGSAIFQSGMEKRPHHHRTQVVIRHTISQRFSASGSGSPNGEGCGIETEGAINS